MLSLHLGNSRKYRFLLGVNYRQDEKSTATLKFYITVSSVCCLFFVIPPLLSIYFDGRRLYVIFSFSLTRIFYELLAAEKAYVLCCMCNSAFSECVLKNSVRNKVSGILLMRIFCLACFSRRLQSTSALKNSIIGRRWEMNWALLTQLADR